MVGVAVAVDVGELELALAVADRGVDAGVERDADAGRERHGMQKWSSDAETDGEHIGAGVAQWRRCRRRDLQLVAADLVAPAGRAPLRLGAEGARRSCT